MFGANFMIDFDDFPETYGNTTVENEIGQLLINGLRNFLDAHQHGILISGSKAFAVMKSVNKYALFDSHACNANGVPTISGRSCLTKVNSIEELVRVIHQAVGNAKNAVYTIDRFDVFNK